MGNAINAIQSNASHLLTIINDILDVSKIEAGQMTVESIDTNPIQIVEEVASLVRPRAIGKGVHVNVRYDSEIPCHITSDPTRLKQILLNLAGNAIKFTEVGSVNIHLACDPKQEQLKLSVIDTGMGMTPEQRDAIAKFEAFSQADASTTRKFGGTGLGLRISNALAHLLGGGIEVESEQGTGSAFHVTISTGDLSNTEMLDPDRVQSIQTIKRAKPAEETLATTSVDALKGVQILLAEDGPDNQRLIKHHLTKAGAEVTVCENGLVAVQAIEGASKDDLPHVILMDMQMPELDGYSATRQLRDKGINLPVIALTAHAMEGDRRKCLDAGCDDYLTKPIDKYTLISTCAKWVEKPKGKSSAA